MVALFEDRDIQKALGKHTTGYLNSLFKKESCFDEGILRIIVYVNENKEICGFINCQKNISGGNLFIESIAVAKKYREQGIASKLLQHVEDEQADDLKIKLLVSEDNLPAIQCYLKNGFVCVDRCPNSKYMTMFKQKGLKDLPCQYQEQQKQMIQRYNSYTKFFQSFDNN